MKQTPNDYAEMLIEKYMQLKQKETLGWSGMNDKMAIQCAINDVNNTIEAIIHETKGISKGIYFVEVLYILKSKV